MTFENGKDATPVMPVEQAKNTSAPTEFADKKEQAKNILSDSEIKPDEVENAKRVFEGLTEDEFTKLLQEFKTEKPTTYENALKSIKTSLEDFGKKLNINTNATLLATINSFKAKINTEIASLKPKAFGETINNNFSIFNEFLKNNNINETFGSMFEKTKESFKETIKKSIGNELRNNKRFINTGKDKETTLNTLWVQVVEKVEKQLTDDRMNNLTFGILNKLVVEANKKITASNGNAEKEIEEKALLFMTMKNIITPKQKTPNNEKIERKGISNKIAEKARMMIQPSTDLTTIEKNLSIFIKAKLKEWGLDIENSRKSIKEWAKKLDYSALDLTWKEKRNEAILSVLGGAFENTFSYLNNKEGSSALLNWLLTSWNETFDASKIDKSTLALENKTQPTAEEQKALGQTLANLVESLPKEKTDPEGAKNLKEKLANGKIDTMLKQLDNLGPLKEIALMVINWLNNSTRWKSILEFFGKSYGLDKKQIEKLLERPLVKSGVDTYKDNIQKIQENGGSIEPISLDKELTDRDIDTNYFRLHDGVVCTRTIDESKNATTYTIKKVDENWNLIDYAQNPDKDTKLTKIKLGAKEIDIDATGKVTKIDNNDLLATDNFLKYFIQSDLHSDSFATAVSSMLDTKEPGNKEKIPATNFGNLEETQRIDKIDTLIGVKGAKIPSMVQELLKNNKYVFSTDDIVAHVLEKALEEYKKSKGGKKEVINPNAEANKLWIELTGVPYTLKAWTRPTEADYQKWIKIPNWKTATYSIDPTINRNNKKAGDRIKDLIVTVTIDGKANEITIPAVTIEAATTTPAATPAKTETPAPAAVPAKTPETPTTAKTPEATAKTT